ncbi:uncharacterized protein LOC119568154 isoform X2 [Penaeus monodon]|uniref:uncharacterized protein LOC119568154 isoform X2 n=1 Tax=Penaeus monodon TaxID=6687 RepID=UPI0018A7182C|nr:uncharacterized protein LOC119568154 isoform X2 [Penaeus monodon]
MMRRCVQRLRAPVKHLLWFAAIWLLTFAVLKTARDTALTPEPWREAANSTSYWLYTADTLTSVDPHYPNKDGGKNSHEGKKRHEEKNSHEGKDGHEEKNSHEGKNGHEEKNTHEGKNIHEAARDGTCACAFKRSDTDFFLAKEYERKIARLNATTLELLESSHPNLPASFLHRRGLAGGCHLLPSQFGIAWHNGVWQEAAGGAEAGESVFLYSAFYDPRTGSGLPPCVRILGMSQRENPDSMWCQLWFDARDAPVVARVADVDHIDYQGKDPGRQMPFLFTCPLPAPVAHLVPSAVSLAPLPCRPAGNALKVVGSRERASSAFVGEKDGKNTPAWSVAVCGPALYYYNEDFSDRLIEWLETLRAMGVAKVFLYETDVAPKVSQVLRHYEVDGFVRTLPYSYPPPYPNHPVTRRIWRHLEPAKMFSQENIFFSDCVLRHMHEYRFIAHFDPDEVPILPRHESLPGLVADLLRSSAGLPYPTYNLQMIDLYEELPGTEEVRGPPPSLWFPRHTTRRKEDPEFQTDMCAESTKRLSPTMAYIGHTKRTCGEECRDRDLFRTETAHLRKRESILQAVTSIKKKLQLI